MEAKYGLSRDFIFKDAVRFLKGKRALTSEEYRLLDDESRAKAFTVSGYTSLQMLQEFLDCLTKAAEEGTTKEQFLKDMNNFLEEHGYEGMNELKFYAVEDTVIDAGAQTGKVLVEAEEPGTYYNVAPGKITISMIHIDGMDYVTNEKEWLIREGADVEDYEDLRSRCTSSWAELATRTIEEKLRNAARSVPGVLDARVDAQHPRGQGTVDIIITSSAGEASPELTAKVEEAVEPLKGQYADYLVRSSEVVVQDINVIIYLAQYASTDGVKEKAQNIITNVMKLPRDEMNTLYKDSIISALCEIENYRKTVFKAPTEDMELSGDKVIMAGNITVEVKNVKGE